MSDYIRKSDLTELFDNLKDGHEDKTISYNALYDIILMLPSVNEAEITRKAFERVLERLEGLSGVYYLRSKNNNYSIEERKEYALKEEGVRGLIRNLKKECGIE